MKNEHAITEVFDISEADFKEEDGRMMATVRILQSGLSKNNRNYRASALKEAVEKKLFDGTRMFIDHDRKRGPLERGMNEMVSAIESTSYHEVDKAIDARVQFFDRPFYEKVQHARKYMGDSINALVRGTRTKRSDGIVEEDIHHIVQPRSVDWVIYPAAGGQILAFESEGEDVDWGNLTLEELRKNAPHLVEEMETALKADPDPKPDDEPGDDDEELTPKQRAAVESLVQERIEKYVSESEETRQKREDTAKKIRAKMATSGLPEKTRARVTAAFEGQTEYVESKVQEAIDSAKEELKAAGAAPVISGNGPSNPRPAPSEQKSYSVREHVEAAFGVKKSTTKSGNPEEGE